MVLEQKKPALTQRQRDIYEFLKDKILNRGYGPTVREIGNHFGIRSPNGVMCHLKALEKKGLITRESHMSRAIQLSDPPHNRLSLPYGGKIVDGQRIVEGDEGQRIDFADLFDAEGHCCVAAGSTYPSIGVNEGDSVIVNRTAVAESGKTVVIVDATGNARICRQSGEHFESLSGGGSFNGQSRVLGVVVASVRRM
ncbi:MAG: LexA family protein [Planctomycetaceae bacterium]